MHETHLKYSGLEYPLPADISLRISATGRHSDNALCVRDYAMSGLDVGTVELKTLSITWLILSLATHFSHIGMNSVPFGVHHFHTICEKMNIR